MVMRFRYFANKCSRRVSKSHSSNTYHPSFRHLSSSSDFLRIDPVVQRALHEKQPVVALESTIVAHGMPYPENINLARTVGSILEKYGVVPATIAVKDGICRVGLTADELEDLAQAGEKAQKCSTRDLPRLIAKGLTRRIDNDASIRTQWGATTVASTMKIAHMAGISTFVTGGIGGVHRDGENSMDISADLLELSQTPVVVISAGIKSILDISRTLEVLESNSVPTYSWKTDEFPAFFSPLSGCPSPARVDSAAEIAASYWAARSLNMKQGMMVAVPNHDPAGSSVEEAIQDALREVDEMNISGQTVTPFILKRVAEKTKGDSLRSNMALVQQNAEVGAAIAKAIAAGNPFNG